MTKLRVVHRPWLARPYVVEQATWIGVYVTEHGEKAQFGPFQPLATFSHENEARDYVEHCSHERIVAEYTVG